MYWRFVHEADRHSIDFKSPTATGGTDCDVEDYCDCEHKNNFKP